MPKSAKQRTSTTLVGQPAINFGAFLKVLRTRQGLRQIDVLAHLPGWTQTNYSRVESDELAPAFDQLPTIYAALRKAGVKLTALDRHQFVLLARARIETKRSHQEHKSQREWDELSLRLGREDEETDSSRAPSRPRLVETRHLVGREEWVSSLLTALQGPPGKKLLVLQGPVGIGKSSELHRLGSALLTLDPRRPHVALCTLAAVERDLKPEDALDLVLAALFAQVGPPGVSLPLTTLEVRMALTLDFLQETVHPLVLLIDNAEHLLDEQGELAFCWKQFLVSFLRSKHCASLVLATNVWPGWFEGERLFVAEHMLPTFTREESVLLLQRLGLAAIPLEHLRTASMAVGGIPLCLEWVASLVHEPLQSDSWESVFELDGHAEPDYSAMPSATALTQRLLRLLEDPALFGGPITTKLKPLLQRILEKRLSAEARQVLYALAVANIPIGKPALQALCPHPRLLKELTSASLLVTPPQRVQVLPMVAALLREQLPTEQKHQLETQLIDALTSWLTTSHLSLAEAGTIITELSTLYLKHHRLLDAAQLCIEHGWLSFNLGHGPRLAHLAQEVLASFDWHTTNEHECGGKVLYYYLPTAHLGLCPDNKQWVSDYQQIYDLLVAEKLAVPSSIELRITNTLTLQTLLRHSFEEAQAMLDHCSQRLEAHQALDIYAQSFLLEARAWLLSKWSELVEMRGDVAHARDILLQTISAYGACQQFLFLHLDDGTVLQGHLWRQRLARALNNIAINLNRDGQYEQALEEVEQSIALREQGYAYMDERASSYSQKVLALMGLGRFREAMLFDEKALDEIQRYARMNYTIAQKDLWIYRINRGRLYLRLGRVAEAEQLLQEALVPARSQGWRRFYTMLGKQSLEEIEQWRQQATSSHYQLDWRWIDRYRGSGGVDGWWWWTATGPFTAEEQAQWEQLYRTEVDDETRAQLSTLLEQARNREWQAALAGEREPAFWYPVLEREIDEVRRNISDSQELDAEVLQQEPNAIVRRLYHDVLEGTIAAFRMFEATYEKNSEQYARYNREIEPVPTAEEMHEVFANVMRTIQQGLQQEATKSLSQQVIDAIQEQLHLACDLPAVETIAREEATAERETAPAATSTHMLSAQTAKRFFEAVFREYGYEGWQVFINPKASHAYVYATMKRVFLPDKALTVSRVKDYLLHELAGHVARAVAGERSQLGLLGLGTRNYLTTEEGLALYQERRDAVANGQPFNDWSTWIGTLATGLAMGIITPPLTFRQLFLFLRPLLLVRYLLEYPNWSMERTQAWVEYAALDRCLRTFRGVPDLNQAGVCMSMDAMYMRGLHLIEQAVAQDATILDQLAVGKVALEYLPDLEELGIVAEPQRLRELAKRTDLDAYILSFETPDSDV